MYNLFLVCQTFDLKVWQKQHLEATGLTILEAAHVRGTARLRPLDLHYIAQHEEVIHLEKALGIKQLLGKIYQFVILYHESLLLC